MSKRLTFILAAILVGVSTPMMAEISIPNNELNQYCQDTVQTMDEIYENGALTKCYFTGDSILEAYQHYRAGLVDGQQFLTKKLMIKTDMDMPCPSEGCVAIRYRWNGGQNLKIEQEFEGGETHLQFRQNSDGTSLEITKHLD
ncbi:hypothetical protein ACIPUA_03190 [Providencia sp. AGC89]